MCLEEALQYPHTPIHVEGKLDSLCDNSGQLAPG